MQLLFKALQNATSRDVAKLLIYAQYASRLKNEILVAQKSTHLPHIAPMFLPDSIVIFLAESCAMTTEDVEECWEIIRDIIWDGSVPDDKTVDLAFQTFGEARGFRECL